MKEQHQTLPHGKASSLDRLQRFKAIELMAMWEGRVNASYLMELFDISKSTAQELIKSYNSELCEGNLEYDRSTTAFIPSQTFTPSFTTGDASDYLGLLSEYRQVNKEPNPKHVMQHNVYGLSYQTPNLSPGLLVNLATAIRHNLRLDVDYRSVTSPNYEGRIIAPHSIAYTGFRWFVRAWCEKNQGYRDFVLSRFYSDGEFEEGSSELQREQDEKWNTLVTVVFAPHHNLEDEQRQVVSKDFAMTNNELRIPIRQSMVLYLLKLYNVDINTISTDGTKQQIEVKNLEEVKQWLPY